MVGLPRIPRIERSFLIGGPIIPSGVGGIAVGVGSGSGTTFGGTGTGAPKGGLGGSGETGGTIETSGFVVPAVFPTLARQVIPDLTAVTGPNAQPQGGPSGSPIPHLELQPNQRPNIPVGEGQVEDLIHPQPGEPVPPVSATLRGQPEPPPPPPPPVIAHQPGGGPQPPIPFPTPQPGGAVEEICMQCQQGQQEIQQAQEMLQEICNQCNARVNLRQQGCSCSCPGQTPPNVMELQNAPG